MNDDINGGNKDGYYGVNSSERFNSLYQASHTSRSFSQGTQANAKQSASPSSDIAKFYEITDGKRKLLFSSYITYDPWSVESGGKKLYMEDILSEGFRWEKQVDVTRERNVLKMLGDVIIGCEVTYTKETATTYVLYGKGGNRFDCYFTNEKCYAINPRELLKSFQIAEKSIVEDHTQYAITINNSKIIIKKEIVSGYVLDNIKVGDVRDKIAYLLDYRFEWKNESRTATFTPKGDDPTKFESWCVVAEDDSPPNRDTLMIRDVSTIPDITQGKAVSISGEITSDYSITSVTVGVYSDSSGGTAHTEGKASPNTTSYNISALDSSVRFGSVPTGKKYFRVTAADTSGTIKELVNQVFTVTATATESSTGGFPGAAVFWANKKSAGWVHPISSAENCRTSQFGNGRNNNTRTHAGLDFHVAVGTKIKAIEAGEVLYASSTGFYAGTGDIQIKHSDNTVARYGEVGSYVKAGEKVSRGQEIGYVKQHTHENCDGDHMLHLEMYYGRDKSGTVLTGKLSDVGNKDYLYAPAPKYGTYERRKDLIDPTGSASLTRTK